jgi:S-formylglutathione hydrolase
MAKTNVRTTAESRCFGGVVSFHEHPSQATGGEMRFSAYVPPQAESGPVPVLY